MPGEHDLGTLLRNLQPILAEDEFVFCTQREVAGDPVCVFREHEGLTLILRRVEAERLGLPFTFPCRMITLQVHSSLEAVGLLAEVAAALAARGIGVNPVSAYYHDHLFVPVDLADDAMAVLLQMTAVRRGNRSRR
jgi:hypothetical protein